MTFYEWIHACLLREAIRTEPDSQPALRKVLEEIARRKPNGPPGTPSA